MAQLHILALQYQQALDSLRGISCTPHNDAADEAGAALAEAMDAVLAAPGASIFDGLAALQTVVWQTTLAASIVAYWERIPWAEVTQQRLSGSGRPLPAALRISSSVLNNSYRSALNGSSGGNVAIPIAARLLRQVCTSCISAKPSDWLPLHMSCITLPLTLLKGGYPLLDPCSLSGKQIFDFY
jgi:hypothetical protein